jgi:hypothetical protein
MGHDVNMHGGVKRDKDTYLEMLERNKILADFKVLGVTGARPVFWDHPRCDVYSLWQPAKLHTFLLGLLPRFIDLLVKMLKNKQLMKRFIHRFKHVPRYPGLNIFKVGYDQVQSWQGKEMRHMLRFLTV